MIGTKLNAQVIIKNLQNMHAKSLPPVDGSARKDHPMMELEYQDWHSGWQWARLQGRGPHTGGPKGRLVGRPAAGGHAMVALV